VSDLEQDRVQHREEQPQVRTELPVTDSGPTISPSISSSVGNSDPSTWTSRAVLADGTI
jgi:hypothetical protein